MNEFERIHQLLTPLAAEHSVSFGLTDDVAMISADRMVITSDTIVRGVHYIGDEPAGLIAKKLLRCNLSDLAAKGATPTYYTLNMTLSKAEDDSWLAAFAQGLKEDQEAYGIKLIGGDSTHTKNGPCMLSVTAFGEIKGGATLPLRSHARIDDVICISGTIGDAAIGLKLLQDTSLRGARGDASIYFSPPCSPTAHTWDSASHAVTPEGRQLLSGSPPVRRSLGLLTSPVSLTSDDIAYLTKRYQLPEPRVALGQALLPYMRASLDISDGLMQDAEHIATCSNVAMDLYADKLPLSPAVMRLLDTGAINIQDIASGGDDYEICCTMSEEDALNAAKIAASLGEQLTIIGRVKEGDGTRLLDASGNPIILNKKGYQHS